MCLRLFKVTGTDELINIPQKISTFPPLCSLRYLRISDGLDLDSNSSLTTASWRCAKRVEIIWGHRYLGNEICGICCSFSKRVRVSP